MFQKQEILSAEPIARQPPTISNITDKQELVGIFQAKLLATIIRLRPVLTRLKLQETSYERIKVGPTFKRNVITLYKVLKQFFRNINRFEPQLSTEHWQTLDWELGNIGIIRFNKLRQQGRLRDICRDLSTTYQQGHFNKPEQLVNELLESSTS